MENQKPKYKLIGRQKYINEHIDFLEESIKDCTDKGDSASWGMQEGILITKNDAKFLVKSLKELLKLQIEKREINKQIKKLLK